MKKRILSWILSCVMLCGVIILPQKAQATDFLSDEMAQQFVDLFYKADKEMADSVKDILTGEKDGTIDEIKDIYSKAVLVFGIVNQPNLFSGVSATVMSDIGTLTNVASGVLTIYENCSSFCESENNIQKTVDGFQVVSGFLRMIGKSSLVPSNVNFALSAIEVGLSIGGFLEKAYLAENLAFYEYDLLIAYYAGDELPYRTAPTIMIGSSITQEEADTLYAVKYMEYRLKQVFEDVNIEDSDSKDDFEVVESGMCGDNLIWTIDDCGIFTIRGYGEMKGSSDGSTPWDSQKSSIKNIIIDNGITSVGAYAFSGCDYLESVTFTKSIINIDKHSFQGCNLLSNIELPSNLVNIGDYAFAQCGNIVDIRIPDSVTYIGSCAFYQCSNLKDIHIGVGVNHIGSGAFDFDYNLTNVYITDLSKWCIIDFERGHDSNPIYLGKNLYINNELATNIIIPTGVKSISKYAFQSCDCLQSVTIGNNVTSIDDYAFADCRNLKNVTIKQGVVSIGNGAFMTCKNLTCINMPNGMSDIDNAVFSGCNSLTSIIIPDGIKTIGLRVFYDCNSLKSIDMPDSVTTIDDSAFSRCYSLESIKIPKEVSTISTSAFGLCNSLTEINVDEDNDFYASFDGNLYNKDLTNFIKYAPGKTNSIYEIPINVNNIGKSAFSGISSTSNLKKVIIPDTVSSIERYAFSSSKSLTNIECWSENVTFESDVFYNHSSDLIINGFKKSTAQKYSEENEITFVPFVAELSTVIEEQKTFEDANITGIKFYVSNSSKIVADGLKVKYGEEERTLTETVITGSGSVLIGAFVPGLVELTESDFEITAIE